MASKGGTSQSKCAPALSEPLLDIEAVAGALAVTPRHVQRLVSERRIPYLKVGRFVRFDPNELNVWLETLRVAPERSAAREYATWR
jgi:excisionase family DNA binding protein